MSQNPLASYIGKIFGGSKFLPVNTDQNGNLLAHKGNSTVLNQTAAAVIKATPGRLVRAIIIAPGTTSGQFTLNDCATTGAAVAANQIWNLAFNAADNVAGKTFDLDIPCAVGIVLSAVPGAGAPVIAFVIN